MKSTRQKVLITEARIIIRMEAAELKQKKYTYMERLGALLYSANRMNTYIWVVLPTRIGIAWMCCAIWIAEHRKQNSKPGESNQAFSRFVVCLRNVAQAKMDG